MLHDVHGFCQQLSFRDRYEVFSHVLVNVEFSNIESSSVGSMASFVVVKH